jgi:hypothetical protein
MFCPASSCTLPVDDQLTGSCAPARLLTAPPPALGLWSRRRRRWRTRAGGCCLCGGLGLLASGRCGRLWLPLGVACWQLASELLGKTLAQRSAAAVLAEMQYFAAGAQAVVYTQ